MILTFGTNGPSLDSQSWALSVFFNIFNNKKWFFWIFYKLKPISAPVLFKKPTPSQINLIKKCKLLKSYFLLLTKLKNTESAQHWGPARLFVELRQASYTGLSVCCPPACTHTQPLQTTKGFFQNFLLFLFSRGEKKWRKKPITRLSLEKKRGLDVYMGRNFLYSLEDLFNAPLHEMLISDQQGFANVSFRPLTDNKCFDDKLGARFLWSSLSMCSKNVDP